MTGVNHDGSYSKICLRATRAGLLDFQWDLLCPLCRGAKQSGLSLKDIDTEVHCATCKIDFTVNFDRYVELTFRPNPSVRRVEVPSYCVGSPEWTPHVVAQQLLRAGDKREITLPLESGNYRLRALELQGSQDVTVSPEGDSSAHVTVSSDGWSRDALHVSEKVALSLKNDTDAEQLLILERMEWSDQATTAAEVTALQMFRDLFRRGSVAPWRTDLSGDVDDPVYRLETFNAALSRDWRCDGVRPRDESFRRRRKSRSPITMARL